MTRTNGLKVFLVAALGALAMLALPAAAGAKDRNMTASPSWEKRHHRSAPESGGARPGSRSPRNRAEFWPGHPRGRLPPTTTVTATATTNAGTVKSFDQETGVLTIALFGGDTIGLVTEGTEIECDDHGGATTVATRAHGTLGPGTTNSPATTKVSSPETTKAMTPESTMAKSRVRTTAKQRAGDDDQGEDHDGQPGEGNDGEPGDDNHERGPRQCAPGRARPRRGRGS